jgi:hypothetical protein
MFGERPASERDAFSDSWAPQSCVLGKLPNRPDLVHYGLHEEPERVFRAWLEHAVLIAGGVLPSRAVRFVVAPRGTPLIGVWVPSRDAAGKPFPLVFMRRLRPAGAGAGPTSDEAGKPRVHSRASASDVRDLPWTLLLAGCAHYLTTAESCLLLGQSESIANLWCRLEALPLPSAADLSELCADAKRSLEREQLDSFANRNLSEPASGAEFASAVRRLSPDARLRRGDASASQSEQTMLAVPAKHEFDVFAWLELLRAQRNPESTPRALFWCPADRRMLVGLGAPLPGTLAFLRQPKPESVQTLPNAGDTDECPAFDNEFRALLENCETLAQLRSAMAGDDSARSQDPCKEIVTPISVAGHGVALRERTLDSPAASVAQPADPGVQQTPAPRRDAARTCAGAEQPNSRQSTHPCTNAHGPTARANSLPAMPPLPKARGSVCDTAAEHAPEAAAAAPVSKNGVAAQSPSVSAHDAAVTSSNTADLHARSVRITSSVTISGEPLPAQCSQRAEPLVTDPSTQATRGNASGGVTNEAAKRSESSVRVSGAITIVDDSIAIAAARERVRYLVQQSRAAVARQCSVQRAAPKPTQAPEPITVFDPAAEMAAARERVRYVAARAAECGLDSLYERQGSPSAVPRRTETVLIEQPPALVSRVSPATTAVRSDDYDSERIALVPPLAATASRKHTQHSRADAARHDSLQRAAPTPIHAPEPITLFDPAAEMEAARERVRYVAARAAECGLDSLYERPGSPSAVPRRTETVLMEQPPSMGSRVARGTTADRSDDCDAERIALVPPLAAFRSASAAQAARNITYDVREQHEQHSDRDQRDNNAQRDNNIQRDNNAQRDRLDRHRHHNDREHRGNHDQLERHHQHNNRDNHDNHDDCGDCGHRDHRDHRDPQDLQSHRDCVPPGSSHRLERLPPEAEAWMPPPLASRARSAA